MNILRSELPALRNVKSDKIDLPAYMYAYTLAVDR